MFWACARVEPRHEAVAAHFLRLNGFVTYIPRVRERRIRAGRRLEPAVPLFPSYAFVAIENGWHRARWTPHVLALIMAGDHPAHVPDAVLEDIRSREVAGIVVLPERELRRGDRVRILAGPFRGERALFSDMKPRQRVEVLLQLLGHISA
jgi:transcriptional antiterminator RfaH